ncbi:MAG: GSU2403 family nucleotidyltransferase fold protein [Pseudomonadota bacterium]
MNYLPTPENAIRQSIDSITIFNEFCRVEQKAKATSGGMYWKRQGEYEYLTKTRLDNTQERLGARSESTEAIYAAFTKQKQEAEARLKSLRESLKEAERLNRALKVGRVPSTVVAVLNAIHQAGLSQNFTVVGTLALYAYEAAAGVRIIQGALATQDADLFWGARRRVKFLTDMARLNTSMLSILQRADASFQRKDDQISTAINDKGFEVDFLRRQPEGDDPHPVQFSSDEDDLWEVQAPRASILTNAARFEQVVTSTSGQMAKMITIDPAVFVSFKRWMAEEAVGRDAARKRRDATQADIVQGLIDEGLLMLGYC